MDTCGSLLQASGLNLLKWLDHGFGTRDAPLTQLDAASLAQIHSTQIVVARTPGNAGEGDALITNLPGLPVSIRTADCFPILLADPENLAIGAVHAGWRGTVGEIVCRALDTMRSEFGTSPQRVFAAIGPGIGSCCYEVGDEVARRFGKTKAGNLDLAAINRAQLENAGVPASQIDTLGYCTKCHPELFHSYRRDGERAGRMISYIMKK